MRHAAAILTLSFAGLLLRCSSDPGAVEPQDAGFDRPFPTDDGGGGGNDADTIPPDAIKDLTIGGIEHDAFTIVWTAPADTFAYQIRYATTPIQTIDDFMAATSVPSQVPLPGGQLESVRITGLTSETTYYVAIRARDAAGNLSGLSNVASGTTKARAAFLITEVAPTNGQAEGFDFVEIVATKAGAAKGIEIRQQPGVLHVLADIDVMVGDRFVIHTTGLPGPTGFQQEDATKNKESSTAAIVDDDAGPPIVIHSPDAYDVYSASTGLTATDNVISIVDNGVTTDALAFSDRDGTASAAAMTAFAQARTAGAWMFTAEPVDGTNDCETQAEAVGVSAVDSACGGFRTGVDNGFSINRNGTTDTNTKRDFYVAAQTPGAANGPIPVPNVVSARPTGPTTLEVRFDQEILPSSAPAGSFTIATGPTVTGTTASSNVVTLTLDAQTAGAPYVVTAANTVTDYHGTPISAATARFCGYSATPAVLRINEVAPNIGGSMDLVELLVTSPGGLDGFVLHQNRTTATSGGNTLATLPAICASTGDIVVVHSNPPESMVSETIAKDEFPQSANSANYDTAWDVRGTSQGITATTATLTIRAPVTAGGAYQDGVVFTNGSDLGNPALSSLPFLQANGLWLPADCNGAACDASTGAAIAASWSGVGSSPTGNTAVRIADPKTATSWLVGPASFGLPNPEP